MQATAFTDLLTRRAETGDPDAGELLTRLTALDVQGWAVKGAMLVPNPDAGAAPRDLIARDRAFLAAIWRSDYAHWQHDIHEWLQGNTTMIVHERRDAAGVLVDSTEIAPPTNMKGEGLDVAPSGDSLVFTGRFHEISSLPTRINLIAHTVREHIYHPYPGTVEPEGAYVPKELIMGSSEPGVPGPSGPTLAEIAAMTQGQFDRLVSLFGGGSVRGGLQEKGADALVWLLTAPDTDPRIAVAQRFRDALFAFHRNLVGAQLWEFAIRSGQVPPSRAPAWVHDLEGYPWGMGG